MPRFNADNADKDVNKTLGTLFEKAEIDAQIDTSIVPLDEKGCIAQSSLPHGDKSLLFFPFVAGSGLVGAGSSMMYGYIGSKILNKLSSNHYDTASIVKSSAVGGSIVFSANMAIWYTITALYAPKKLLFKNLEENKVCICSSMCGNILLTLSAVIGSAVLNSDKRSTVECAAAAVVGITVKEGLAALGL